VRDYGRSRVAPELQRAWSDIRKDAGHADTWSALECERNYRRLAGAAIRAHMKVGNVIREGRAYLPAIRQYETALQAAPEDCRGALTRLVADLKALK
jgi:hypothetical protein